MQIGPDPDKVNRRRGREKRSKLLAGVQRFFMNRPPKPNSQPWPYWQKNAAQISDTGEGIWAVFPPIIDSFPLSDCLMAGRMMRFPKKKNKPRLRDQHQH
jgi:hypothetical protein